MPLIKVQTSAKVADSAAIQDLQKSLSQKLAQHLSKPEAYVMTTVETNVAMSFAGTFDPVCYLEVKNIGTMAPQQTKAMSQDFSLVVSECLGVSGDRIYIEFANVQGAMWGWNGSTFG
jgi:phenylpyruvate tautomerase PptA (4-oxalocrotonate tautomerase family)